MAHKLNILIVYKDKPYQNLIKRYVRHHNDANIKKLTRGRKAHLDTLKRLKIALKTTSAECTFLPLTKRFCLRETGHSLIITVGGDGTFLDMAQCVQKTPILGINSSPGYSEGFFSGLNRFDVGKPLLELLERPLKPLLLNRLQCFINGKPLRELVLNDVLICHAEPGATSRYVIKLGKQGPAEEQKGSGVWIATASGSTAAIYSAGGKIMPLRSKKIQFLARELYVSPRKHCLLKKGVVSGEEGITITSRIEHGVVCIDGPRVKYPFPYKATLRILNSPNPLGVVGISHDQNQKRRS